MAETQARPSYPAFLQIGDSADPPVYTTIAEVKDFPLPSETADLEEATNHDSVDGYEEHVPTIIRTGTMDFDVNLLPFHATHMNGAGSLRALARARKRVPMKAVLHDADPDATPAPLLPSYMTFKAFVLGLAGQMPVGGIGTARVSVKPTGAVTFVVRAAAP